MLVVGCGRLGYDLLLTEGASGVGGAPANTDGGSSAGGGGSSAADGSVNHGSGGTLASGSTGGADASVGTGGADASVGTGGQPTSGDARVDGSAGAGGFDGGSYTCTPGARELCDGRDNNCDLVVDEVPACPSKCVGRAWGNHGYMLCDIAGWWSEAQTICETAGLHLVRIDSQEENDFIFAFAYEFDRGDVWTGGSDLTAEGDWRWTDGTPFWSGVRGDEGAAIGSAYTHWLGTTEPNGSNGAQNGEGDCLAMTELLQGSWLDEGCNYFNRALCETP